MLQSQRWAGLRGDGVGPSRWGPLSFDQLSSNVTRGNLAFPQNPAAVLSSWA